MLWVVSTITDAAIWRDLLGSLAFAAAIGLVEGVGDLTPHEQKLSRRATQMQPWWRERTGHMYDRALAASLTPRSVSSGYQTISARNSSGTA